LTLISAVSIVVSVRWWNKHKADQPVTIRPSDILVMSGDQTHVQ
jgi:hypothetical protein